MELEPSLLPLAAEPISGESPVGIAIKYEDSFQALEAELAKQESLTAATVDWRLVESLARSILTDQSKDILVGSYLAMALVQNQGYSGMLQGFTLLQRLSEQWWDDMFPPLKRIRGRAAAVTWLTEKASWYIESKPPAGPDLSVVPALYEAISSLDQFLAEKMADKAPDMTSLIRPLRQLKKAADAEVKHAEAAAVKPPLAEAAPKPAPESNEQNLDSMPAAQQKSPVSEPSKPQSPQTASTIQTSDISADVSSDSDANKAIRKVQDALRKLSSFYGESKPAEPRRFRLSRYAMWLSIDALPPNKEGKTQVPPPPKDLASKAQQSLDQADFTGAIDQVEKQLAKLPYWFEGHRLQVVAMEQLGGSHQAALQVVRSELRGLIERLPGLLELAYSDGTPFIDDATRFWLTQTILVLDSEPSAGGNSDGALQDARQSAVKLAASGKIGDAITELQSFAMHSGSKRDEYHARLALAEVLMDSGQSAAALPILDRLSSYIEEHGLAEWEPDFAKQCYQLLYLACQREASNDENDADALKHRQSAAYTRLCWFDPGSAVT